MLMAGATLEAVLSAGLKTLKLDCSLDVQAQLLDYVRLLHKWNGVYNLTAVRDPAEMVTRHLLDSLIVLPFLKGEWILDVGTGAGLPGIPLALLSAQMHPERKFVLLDSNSKKTRFMQQAVTELGLVNVQVVHARTESFVAGQRQSEQDDQSASGFDVVVSRAFASVADMLAGAGQHCAGDGVILAMKGADPAAELLDLDTNFVVDQVHRLVVPGLDEERHLVSLRRAGYSA